MASQHSSLEEGTRRLDTSVLVSRLRFFEPLLQAPGSARIDPFQLPEDFLQRLFGLRVVVLRVGISHPPIALQDGLDRGEQVSWSRSVSRDQRVAIECEGKNCLESYWPLVQFWTLRKH